MGGEAFLSCALLCGCLSKKATAITPATARRDSRVDHRASVNETSRPLGSSLLLANSFSRVPRVAATPSLLLSG